MCPNLRKENKKKWKPIFIFGWLCATAEVMRFFEETVALHIEFFLIYFLLHLQSLVLAPTFVMMRQPERTRTPDFSWIMFYFFFQMQALKWKSSFLFNLKWTQKGSGRSPPASPAKTANGVSGKMTLFVGVLAHLSLYIALRWAHSGPVISTPFRKKVMLMAFT